MNGFRNILKWSGIAGLLVMVALLLLVLVDRLVMPVLTRNGQEMLVPVLIGLDVDAARSRAVKAGFKLVLERTRPDVTGRYQENQVMEQFPRSGGQSKQGRRIYISVCSGGQYVLLPDLSGLSVRQAAGRLADLDLSMDSLALSYRFDTRLGKNAVLEQSPLSGDSLLPGGRVTFVLSLGPEPEFVEVPGLQGLQLSAARRILNQTGLLTGSLHHLLEDGKPGVRRQKPAAGFRASPGTEVELWINAEEP